jgi:hypothetical protein
VDGRRLISYDERDIDFDLLVTVPLNMGADFIARSGLGDELNLVHVDRETMRSTVDPHVFVLGDASDLPTSKAGSVAHFAVETFTNNFVQLVHGEPMTDRFDGHANCFVESGDGRALLLDFNYDTQPLPGQYPVPGVSPLSLLTETSGATTGASSPSAGCTGTSCCPDGRCPCPRTCPWPASTPRSENDACHHHRKPRDPRRRRGVPHRVRRVG